MKLATLLSCQMTFFVHDLHELKDRGVPIVVVTTHYLVYIFYADRPFFPYNAKDVEFFFGGFRHVLLTAHSFLVRIVSYYKCIPFNAKGQVLLRKYSYDGKTPFIT